MKTIIVLLCLLILSIPALGQVYSAESTIDTVSFPFAVIDSSGQAVALAADDSVYVTVCSPTGTVILNEKLAYNDAKIHNNRTAYFYNNLVSTILAGGSGTYGVYGYGIEVWDTTLELRTQFGGTFQVIADRYNDYLSDKTNYQLADNAITAAKIATDAITADKIATGAIGTAEFNDNTAGEVADSVWALATRTLTGSVDVATFSGDAAITIDSTLALVTRAALALYAPCDSSFVREYPLGQKPKDSICVYCISATGPGTADTTKVATLTSHIHSKSTSTENVIDSLGFEKK